MSKRAIVLWTGGKDSSLALYKAKEAGYEIARLVTFVPSKKEFLAHPLSVIKCQAEALGIPHEAVEIREPFREGYEKAICFLKEKYGIDTLVTGDIAEVEGNPNWIKECSRSSGVEVFMPLWHWEREEILRQLFSYQFKIIFSCVKKPWFTVDWLGKELTPDTLKQLRELNVKSGLDICGENGEYHTLVLDGPSFKQSVYLSQSVKREKDSLMYLDIQHAVLREK